MIRLLARTGIALVLSMFASLVLANPLIVSIEPGNSEGSITVHLSNTSGAALSILKWDTPFEKSLSHDVFRVEKYEKGFPFPIKAEYTGREVKRAFPTDDSFIVLRSGQTLSANVQLNDFYDIEAFGEHSVRFEGQLYYEAYTQFQSRSKNSVKSIAEMETKVMGSNNLKMDLTPSFISRLRPLAYNSCSAQQQSEILQASSIAEDLTATALSDLRNLPSGERAESPRYTTWFGAYSDARYNTVTSNFDAIGRAFDNANLQFNCDCDETGIYAFVYPDLPYAVTLCPSFWTAPLNGLNSKAGTIIHELSHFSVVAGTVDHAYQVSATQRLAQTNPNLAIDNGDNMEYFAENDPPLTMRNINNSPSSLGYPTRVSIHADRSILGIAEPIRLAI